MGMRSVRIQTVPLSVGNRNLSLANLTNLFKDVCLGARRETAVSVFEFVLQKDEILERKGKTERHSSSSLFETLYSSHHFMATTVKFKVID